MKKLLCVISLLAVLCGCSNSTGYKPTPIEGQVDVNRMLGKWYVIGVMPGLLDKNAYNISKTYQRGDKGIDIFYEFNAGAYDGDLKSYKTSAMVYNPGINTHWRVRILTWPFDRDYKVLDVAGDYSSCIVGTPDRNNGVWIMSRTKRMEDPLYSDYILKLQSYGYNVGRIRKVPQR